MVDVGLAQSVELPMVEALYAAAGYGGGIGTQDFVIVARHAGQIVGAARLCPEQGLTVLRGMQVSAQHQRQGIGARLLAACTGYLDQGPAFCLPYAHLAAFYGAARFVSIDQAVMPDFLARRMATYLARGQDIIAMRRDGPAGLTT